MDSRSPPSKKAKTKFPKIFQCTGYGDCKMTFTRSEHLARHIRKHTGERPFRCHCNRTFSRLDNLRQHIQTVHANEHHILHAPPPPPLPHTNKVEQQQYQQQYFPSYDNSKNIIIEQHSINTPEHTNLYQPPAFNPKHRPSPIALPDNHGNGNGNYMESPRHSPSSPYFYGTNNNNNNNNYPSTPQLNSYRSTSSVSSSRQPSSNLSTPVSTNSWLSSVLNDNSNHTPSSTQGEQLPPVEERPHTWGPSSNSRYSSGYENAEYGDRNSLSQLVRITEDAHISTPQPENGGGLPSLSSVLTPNSNDIRPPQLSSNRSYTKNLILPRPDSYPPKGYNLPVADTRPPALPPAGSEVKHHNSSMDKPLPPLPDEAKNNNQEQQENNGNNKDGNMDVLLQAAGV